jgi:hypothetical protein
MHPIFIKVVELFKEEVLKYTDLKTFYYREKNVFRIYNEHCNLSSYEMDPTNVPRFIDCMCIQLNLLESFGYTFSTIKMEDIIVIEPTNPIFMVIRPIEKIVDDHIEITTIEKHDFMQPGITHIPARIHKSSVYYCIGLFVFLFLFHYPPITEIESIKGTRIYYFMKRCFESKYLFFI